MKRDLEILYDKIVQWAKDRKIIPNAQILVQAAKLVSEKSEISEAFKNYDGILLKDAIGDTFVTIVNTFELIKLKEPDVFLDLDSYVENFEDYVFVSSLLLDIDIETGKLLDNIIKENYKEASENLNNLLNLLKHLSNSSEISFVECVEYAYNQIKDRKGITLENGTFIKESDPRYEQIIKELK